MNMKNELKKLPFTITRLVIPYMMILQIVGVVEWNSYDSQKLLSFVIYCGMMIWFSHEVCLIAYMRFEDDEFYSWADCSFLNKLHFWIFAVIYVVCIPVLIFYGKNFLAFVNMIMVWSNIGYANDHNFKPDVDNSVSVTLAGIAAYRCADFFKGEFNLMGIWGYIIVLIAVVCLVVFVFGNIDNPEFKEAK